ncbi:MAG: hypothetical protein IH908_04080 [Proteobacteria bacterium]|nr:hypothetical protein [Pseudomonadota bacterium]
MEWTIQDLGAVGEFIGAIGVVITLVYLAHQIRQNTAQLKQNIPTAKAAALNASNIAVLSAVGSCESLRRLLSPVGDRTALTALRC